MKEQTECYKAFRWYCALCVRLWESCVDGHRHLRFWLRFRVQLLPHLRRQQLKLLRSDLWLVRGGQKPYTCLVLSPAVCQYREGHWKTCTCSCNTLHCPSQERGIEHVLVCLLDMQSKWMKSRLRKCDLVKNMIGSNNIHNYMDDLTVCGLFQSFLAQHGSRSILVCYQSSKH